MPEPAPHDVGREKMRPDLMSVVENSIETETPACLDLLPWTRRHLYTVAALGTVEMPDGLEVTDKGVVGMRVGARPTR